MLGTRIVTAIILLAITAFCLTANEWIQHGYIAAWIVLCVWEWTRLRFANRQSKNTAAAIAFVAAALTMAWVIYRLLHNNGDNLPPTAVADAPVLLLAAAWLLYIFFTISQAKQLLSGSYQQIFYAVGLLLLFATGWCLLVSFQTHAYMLLSAMTLVWVADIGAYFAGRAMGKRKLAAHISPGKTWEGVYGAIAAVFALAALWIWLDTHYAWGNSIFSILWKVSPLALIAAIPCLVACSVSGDLVESLAKRMANVKDSSQLLPGHGGVLDRIDALLPTLPVSLALAQLLQ